MRTHTTILPALLLLPLVGGCYNPTFSANPDAGMGFQCFASDTPPCPSGLTCCAQTAAGNLCGDQLQQSMPNLPGWCVVPPPPQDLALTAASVWDFGQKSTYYTGSMMDPMLTGYDDMMNWRCPRDDTNPADKTYAAKQEPNDLPSQAINFGTLVLDFIRSDMAAYRDLS